jgi:hypothetical protein
VTAVQAWAKQEHVSLKTVTATAPDQYISQIIKAIDLAPDLIINAGNDLVDPLAMVTPNHLDQQFLVVGAELAEPTANVTAADWTGASFRGEGLGMSSSYDPDSFTPERAAAAVRAGVASVLSGLTGIVICLASCRVMLVSRVRGDPHLVLRARRSLTCSRTARTSSCAIAARAARATGNPA